MTQANSAALKPPRGIRNRNPGNIRRGPSKWKGLAPDTEQTDPDFCVFRAPEWGIRAIARILITYRHQHRARTIAEVIATWAPSSENNTAAYIAAVAKETGHGAHEIYDYTARPELERLVRAIIRHENGQQPYSDAVIKAALDLALGPNAV